MADLDTQQKDPIYDNDDQPGWRTNIGNADLNDLENSAAASDPTEVDLTAGHPSRSVSKPVASAKELKSAEEKPKESDDKKEDENSADKDGGNWRTNLKKVKNSRSKMISKLDKLKSRRKSLSIAAGGGLALAGLMVMFVLMLGNMKLIQVAETLTSYNMARTARTFRQSIGQNTEAAIESEAISEGRFAALKTRWPESSVKSSLDKFNSYRPAKVMEQLKSDLVPVFEDGPPSKILGRQTKVFKGWEFEGALVEKTDKRFGLYTPRDQKLRFSAELNAILEEKNYGANSAVRTRAINQFLKEKGLGKLRFWDKKMLASMTDEAAEVITAQRANELAKTPRSAAAVEQIDKGVKAGDEAIDDVVKNAKTETQEEIAEKAAEAGTKAIKSNITSTVSTALQYTSFVYGVAVPLCLIFDGSIENAKDTIDNSETALMRSFFMIRTSADEMKQGGTATSPQAIKAMNAKLGDVSSSVAIRRSVEGSIDPTKEVDAAALPQASSAGTFSLFDVLLGDSVPKPILDSITDSAKNTCGVITSVWTGVGLAAAELALAVVTLGGSKGAEEGAQIGFRAFLTNQIGNLAAKIGLEQGFREAGVVASAQAIKRAVASAGGRLLAKTGLQVGATIGLTELAHLAVLKHMNSANVGLDTDATLINQADMGGNLYAQTVNRKFLYGRPLIQTDVIESKADDVAYLQSVNGRKDIKDRYIALDNPDSALSKLSFSFSSTKEKPLQSMGHQFANLSSSLSRLPSKAIKTAMSGRVHADEPISGAGDYNIVQWGWTREETNLIENNDDFKPLENDLILDVSGKKELIEEKYSKCYDLSDGELLSKGYIQRKTNGELIVDKGDCSPMELGLSNKVFGNLVMRWRLAKRNDNILNHFEEIQNAQ